MSPEDLFGWSLLSIPALLIVGLVVVGIVIGISTIVTAIVDSGDLGSLRRQRRAVLSTMVSVHGRTPSTMQLLTDLDRRIDAETSRRRQASAA